MQLNDKIDQLVVNNKLIKDLNTKFTTKNKKLRECIDENTRKIFELTNPKIEYFNSVHLKAQQLIIAEIISNPINDDMRNYFNKINNLLQYLMTFKNLECIYCFEILINESILLSENTKEYQIILTYNAIEALDNMNLLYSKEFINQLKNFNKISIEIRYPSESFDTMSNNASKLLNNFNGNPKKLLQLVDLYQNIQKLI